MIIGGVWMCLQFRERTCGESRTYMFWMEQRYMCAAAAPLFGFRMDSGWNQELTHGMHCISPRLY
jgi:hypothetical protein